jgi:protoporphyrinogen oxidase
MPGTAILGGGMAGLAAGYYASKSSLPFHLYERSARIGGTAVTYANGDFLYDSGAHRFHANDDQTTEEMFRLLGDELLTVSAPSQICHEGKFIDFPLSPLNLISALGMSASSAAAWSFLKTRLSVKEEESSFRRHAIRRYGPEIARRFLLGYSEKLWGDDSENLLPEISGKRLNGLTLKTFVVEFFLGQRAKTAHLDGIFYYPRRGIGMIPEAMADSMGRENVSTGSECLSVLHRGGRITHIVVRPKGVVPVDQLITTIPVSRFATMFEPALPDTVLAAAEALRFRDMLLLVLFVDKPRVSDNASIYFPDPEVPFTRVYEPKNRSWAMSPPGQTALVVEFPTQRGGPLWGESCADLTRKVAEYFSGVGLLDPGEVIGSTIHRMPAAYPVLNFASQEAMKTLKEELFGFRNLHCSGRGGLFIYAHMHDMHRLAREIIGTISGGHQ